jgi:hypothetical protein
MSAEQTPAAPPRPASVVESERILAEFFAPHLLSWRPRLLNSPPGECDVIPVVDVRAVEDRLDRAFGADGWQTRYRELSTGQVECTLRLRFPGTTHWVTRVAVGFPELAPPLGDVVAATRNPHEDALKRAGQQLGIGRYLDRVRSVRGEWDGTRVTKLPPLPEAMLPADMRKAGPRLADQAAKLALTYAQATRQPVERYTAHLLKSIGKPETAALADLETRQVRRMMQTIADDMAAHEKAKAAASPAA